MDWFKHDTTALNDAKLKKIIKNYGVTGYAIYFHCLELIAGNVNKSNITFELEHDSEIIADDLRIMGNGDKSGQQIVEEIMRYMVSLDLFQSIDNRIFCFKLLKRMDQSMTSNRDFRKMIVKAKENHDIVMIESCQNHGDVMKEEIRRDKNRKEEKRIDITNKNQHLDHVYLTEDEYNRIVSDYGEDETNRMIQKLDTYLEDHPEKRIDGKKPYHSHNKTMRTWANSDKKDQNVSTRKGTVIV